MAKRYSIKNTTSKPIRPLGLMVSGETKADGSSFKPINGEIPVVLTAAEYEFCKSVVTKYVNAGMMSMTELDDGEDDESGEKSEKDKLEEYAKEKFGVDLDKRKGLAKLKAEVAALEEGE